MKARRHDAKKATKIWQSLGHEDVEQLSAFAGWTKRPLVGTHSDLRRGEPLYGLLLKGYGSAVALDDAVLQADRLLRINENVPVLRKALVLSVLGTGRARAAARRLRRRVLGVG